jgi:2-polyprenyl-3-methyl-5-hydroxy-6-metoxy-1,4-benzoquinol methylase
MTMTHERMKIEKQGRHPDPFDPNAEQPDPPTWPERRQRAFASDSMRAYQRAMLLPGIDDVRAAILDDLSQYSGLTPDECVRRCIEWEQWSVEEWQKAPRDDDEGLREFYTSNMSWCFDLMWYCYLQATGFAYPVSVAIAESLPPVRAGQRHLDFGAGVGVTSQLFGALGYETDLADVATRLLEFARFRFDRRGLEALFIDLNASSLEANRYDVITAIDTLVHVPDVAETAADLHRALRPGGYLFANFDVRPPTAENAWHLYADDLPLRFTLQRAGFEPEEVLDGMITKYRRVETGSPQHAIRGVRDLIMLRSPLRPTYRFLRALASRLANR